MALFSVSVHEYTCYLWLDIVEDILYWWSLIFFPQVSSWTYWVEISLSGLWLYPSVHPLSPPSNNLLTCEWHWSMGHCHEAMMNWIIYTRICLPSCFQSNGKSNHVTLKKVQPFSLWPLMGSVRSRPWQDPMSDPKNSSQACPWPKSGPFFPFPRQSPLSTEPLRSTKTTQLGNKNAEGQKDGWGWMGGGGGVQTNHIWSNASQWLFNWEYALRSIWTVTFRPCLYKSDVPFEKAHELTAFSRSVWCGSGPQDTHITGPWRQGEELHFETTHWVLSVLAFVSCLLATVPARRKKTIRGQLLDWSLPNQIANGCRCRTNLWRGLSCEITAPTFLLPHRHLPKTTSLLLDGKSHKKNPL